MSRGLAVLLAAVPFAFGLIRAVTTGWDYRYVWIALAAFLGATVTLWIAGAQRRRHRAATLMAALVIACVLAAAIGWFEGARSASAIVLVAGGFAVCEAVACALYLSSPTHAA